MRVGDIVTITNSEDPDWWEGECNGTRGIFPVSYTEAMKSVVTPGGLHSIILLNNIVSFRSLICYVMYWYRSTSATNVSGR
jgi:hypothetical protein